MSFACARITKIVLNLYEMAINVDVSIPKQEKIKICMFLKKDISRDKNIERY